MSWPHRSMVKQRQSHRSQAEITEKLEVRAAKLDTCLAQITMESIHSTMLKPKSYNPISLPAIHHKKEEKSF
jgi:hypothetical protein